MAKWMKNPKYGTVVLPSGKILDGRQMVEAEYTKEQAEALGLVQLLEEPAPAPAKQLLTDAQPGARAVLTEKVGDDTGAPAADPDADAKAAAAAAATEAAERAAENEKGAEKKARKGGGTRSSNVSGA